MKMAVHQTETYKQKSNRIVDVVIPLAKGGIFHLNKVHIKPRQVPTVTYLNDSVSCQTLSSQSSKDPSRSRSIPHSENTLNQQADSYESTYPYMTEPMLPMQGALETEVEPSGLTHAEDNNYGRGRTLTHSSHQVETLVRLNLDIYKSKH
ncbi:hypothetical protein QYM36_014416 [Artemia franciscana]|uniref:Uncharacterized protein n=1 Tax=Artemia franciscana TaxID=6661 RepID=A0AA88KY00_ARTSF|nr:hypothetical protein QYM36_014416 [Artemia franciscana]